jgi:cytochrome c5
MTDGTGNGYCADFVNDRTRLAKTDEELILSVKHGMGNMPGYGWMLSDEDLQKVIQYIRDAFGDK